MSSVSEPDPFAPDPFAPAVGGHVLPIAGVNFAAVFTLLAIIVAVLHGILQALTP